LLERGIAVRQGATLPASRVAGYPGNTVRYALTSHATGYRGAGFGLTLRR
jgi:hypothetical protein